jgi:hypothetical protein
MLCLMLVGHSGWVVLLARSAASKDAGPVLRQEVAVRSRSRSPFP